MIGLQTTPIDPMVLHAAVSRPESGAVLIFMGETRNNFKGRRVLRLEYEAYEEMAIQEMNRIASELQERWPDARCAMIHRLGVVPVGEVSVVVAVSAGHRKNAYLASRFGIDELKSRVPIWKKEIFETGEEWKANSPN